MKIKANILGTLKTCIVVVLLATFLLGTAAFWVYFKDYFQTRVVGGVHTVVESVNSKLKDREKQYVVRKQALGADYLTRLGYDTAVLQQTVPSTLWNLEPDAAELILKAFLNKEEIAAIRVDDESGKLFAALQKKDGAIVAVKEEKDFSPLGKMLAVELAKGGKRIGQVKLFYNEAPLERQMAQVDNDLSSFKQENTKMVGNIDENLKETIDTESGYIIWMRLGEMVVVFLIVLGVITLFIKVKMQKPLSAMLGQLTESSGQIKAAATQVAKGAEVLAAVTSTEAASVEETSATVQELSSMTQRNADHAKQTDHLMQETRQTVSHAGTSMSSLFASIQEIKQSSAATSKIIKTIDEISFQTNILALNAAVEAARVGVHGAGFAVVADEVRSLAQRAAEAAKDTSNLIENTNRQINQAAGLVEETRKRFEEVNTQVGKSSGFVSQIAEASVDQARGLEQLNTTIGEIGKVVQQNAASSEESAAASQEMSAQADAMGHVINSLSAMLVVRGEKTVSVSTSLPTSNGNNGHGNNGHNGNNGSTMLSRPERAKALTSALESSDTSF